MAVSFWHSKVLGILPFPGRRPPWQFPCPSPALVGRPPDQVRRAMWPAVTAEGDRRAPGQALDRQQHTNNGYTGRHTDTFSNLEGQGPRAPRLFAHANHILSAAGSPRAGIPILVTSSNAARWGTANVPQQLCADSQDSSGLARPHTCRPTPHQTEVARNGQGTSSIEVMFHMRVDAHGQRLPASRPEPDLGSIRLCARVRASILGATTLAKPTA